MVSRLFIFRDMVERWVIKDGRRYLDTRAGYSEDGELGPCKPLMTKKECREYAKKFGARAKFKKNKSMISSFRITGDGEVWYEANKKGKCWCGKRKKVKKIFSRIENQFDQKSRDDICQELLDEARRWEKEPITCDNCS